jgi:uncharacterized membrane protein HdeD (DUF308 family)
LATEPDKAMPNSKDYRATKRHKIIGVSFGVFLMLIAVVLIIVYEPGAGLVYVLGIALFVLLGLNQIISVLQERDSIMDKIGPLP